MKRCIATISFLTVYMVLFSILTPSAHGQKSIGHLNLNPASLKDVILRPANFLFQWPDDSVLNGPKRVEPIASARYLFYYWINETIAEPWRPPAEAKPIFIHGEFQGRDVVRLAWEKNGYKVQVAQTISLFTIKLTRSDGKGLGKDMNERVARAKQVCLELFNKNGRRRTGQGQEVIIPDLNQKIISYSFNPNSIHQVKSDGAVWGNYRTMEEEGVDPIPNAEESKKEDNPDNKNWDKSWMSWDYWFRNISWWNDGQSIGFYFIKGNGMRRWVTDPIQSGDANWFEMTKAKIKQP